MILSPQELLLRLSVAALLGSAIGFEREWLLRAAGLRTHMLVCVGSALIMIVSAYGFAEVLSHQNVTLDPSRVAAQVVSGIGFLGAGTILLRNDVVRGLTTAASLWVVAGVGLAVGGGLYTAGVATTVIVLIILIVLKPLERQIFGSRHLIRHLEITIDSDLIENSMMESIITLGRVRMDRSMVSTNSEAAKSELEYVITAQSLGELEQLVATLRALPGVKKVALSEL